MLKNSTRPIPAVLFSIVFISKKVLLYKVNFSIITNPSACFLDIRSGIDLSHLIVLPTISS